MRRFRTPDGRVIEVPEDAAEEVPGGRLITHPVRETHRFQLTEEQIAELRSMYEGTTTDAMAGEVEAAADALFGSGTLATTLRQELNDARKEIADITRNLQDQVSALQERVIHLEGGKPLLRPLQIPGRRIFVKKRPTPEKKVAVKRKKKKKKRGEFYGVRLPKKAWVRAPQRDDYDRLFGEMEMESAAYVIACKKYNTGHTFRNMTLTRSDFVHDRDALDGFRSLIDFGWLAVYIDNPEVYRVSDELRKKLVGVDVRG